MLGAAEPNTLRAKSSGVFCILRRIRIRADIQLANLICPFHECAELPTQFRLNKSYLAAQHIAGGTVQRDVIALGVTFPLGVKLARVFVDEEGTAASDTTFPHPTRDDSGVARHAPAGGEDTFRSIHPTDVLRRGFGAHQNHFFTGSGALFRTCRREDDLANSRTGRSR